MLEALMYVAGISAAAAAAGMFNSRNYTLRKKKGNDDGLLR